MDTERITTGAVEIRRGKRLAGIALPWNTRSETHKEKFEPRSVELAAPGVSFNLGHDPEKVISFTGAGLTVESRADGLWLESELSGANPAARRARELVEKGHRGLSIEFKALRETRDTWGDRIIQSAIVSAVALVNAPSYPTSAELRRKRGGRARILPGAIRACECVGKSSDGKCDRVDFTDTAFVKFVATLDKREADLVAHSGKFDPANILASLKAGTLAVRADDAGALLVDIDPAALATPAGVALVASAPATMPVARPIIDDALSEYEDRDGVRVYSMPWIKNLLLKTAPNPDGWEAVDLPPPPRNRRGLLLL